MSLTKKILLSELACSKPEKLPQQFLGHDVWVRPVSEFQRSRRVASMTDRDGNIKKDAMVMARLHVVVDHICDSDGQPLFTEKDIKELRDLDALKLDSLLKQIEEWQASREGKL